MPKRRLLHADLTNSPTACRFFPSAIEAALVSQFLASCEAPPTSRHGGPASSRESAASHSADLRSAAYRTGTHNVTPDSRLGRLAARCHVTRSALHVRLNDPPPDCHPASLDGRVPFGLGGGSHRHGKKRADGERQPAASGGPGEGAMFDMDALPMVDAVAGQSHLDDLGDSSLSGREESNLRRG